MSTAFEQVDVFTDRPFAGNPLCVVPDGAGLSTAAMQAIAREMNLSETTFVLPPTDPHATYRMRIFTPARELPFAGHPSIGTAWILARAKRFPLSEPVTRVWQEVGIGTLPLDIEVRAGAPGRVVMTQGAPTFGPVLRDVGPIATALGLPATALGRGAPQVVSTGIGHLLVPLPDLSMLEALRPDSAALSALLQAHDAVGCFVFVRVGAATEVLARARMFAPGVGVPEDPATGSAAGPLGAYLAAHGLLGERKSFTIEQGVEMGRPSRLWVEVECEASGMPRVLRVGGDTVAVMRGTIEASDVGPV